MTAEKAVTLITLKTCLGGRKKFWEVVKGHVGTSVGQEKRCGIKYGVS